MWLDFTTRYHICYTSLRTQSAQGYDDNIIHNGRNINGGLKLSERENVRTTRDITYNNRRIFKL